MTSAVFRSFAPTAACSQPALATSRRCWRSPPATIPLWCSATSNTRSSSCWWTLCIQVSGDCEATASLRARMQGCGKWPTKGSQAHFPGSLAAARLPVRSARGSAYRSKVHRAEQLTINIRIWLETESVKGGLFPVPTFRCCHLQNHNVFT